MLLKHGIEIVLGAIEAIGGLGAEPPALENFAFFFKNNLVLGLY